MASFNRTILLGNVTRDIELRYTPAGTAVADMGLAVNDRRKLPNGDYEDEVSFVDVVLWSRNAEVAAEYLKKGSPVLIEGRLKEDRWQDKEGQKRSRLRVVCEKLQLLGGGKGGQGGQSGGKPQGRTEEPSGGGDDYGGGPPDDDPSIPF